MVITSYKKYNGLCITISACMELVDAMRYGLYLHRQRN